MRTEIIDSLALEEIKSSAETCAARLRLPFQEHVWKGQPGDFQGAGTGSSLDFQDHRSYVPGDDPRHINWQAYARTGTYSLKQYREETRPFVDLVIDATDSMFFEPGKAARAMELLYFAFHATMRASASLQIIAVRGKEHRRLENQALLGGGWLSECATLAESESAEEPLLAALPFRRQSMRILVSDLLFPSSPEPVLQALSRNQGFGVVLSPFAKQEADPDWNGNYEFVDAETDGMHARRIDPRTLERYRDAYRRHFDLWKSLARRYEVKLARVPAGLPLGSALEVEGFASGAIAICH